LAIGAEGESAPDGDEPEIGPGAGVASADRGVVLHITKLPLAGDPARIPAGGVTGCPPNPPYTYIPPLQSSEHAESMAELALMDKLVSLSKRRGFIFQS